MFSALYYSCSTGWSPKLCDLLQQNTKLLSALHLRRARGYYLYTSSKKGMGIPERLCDLSLNAGQALLGHRPAGVSSQLKNVMSRGLFGAFPSGGQRLGLLLKHLFPNLQDFRVYHSIYSLGLSSVAEFLRDRQATLLGGKKIQLWRPLSTEKNNAAYFVPVLAFSPLLILVLVEGAIEELPPSDICSPLQLEALIQALALTKRLLCNNNYLELEVLHQVCQQNWAKDGIYLYWNSPDLTLYARLWQEFLQAGFLLPLNPFAPLVLPPALLQGTGLSSEGKRLRHLLQAAT